MSIGMRKNDSMPTLVASGLAAVLGVLDEGVGQRHEAPPLLVSRLLVSADTSKSTNKNMSCDGMS